MLLEDMADNPPRLRVFDVASVDDTRCLAQALAVCLRAGDVLGLTGDLGSGKTTFTRWLVEGIGTSSEISVASPTYVLEHIYSSTIPLHHYDAYRLGSSGEFLDLGFDERVQDGRAIVVVEWADRVADVFPPTSLWVDFGFTGSGGNDMPTSTGRTLTFSGREDLWASRLANLKFPAPHGG